MIVPSEVCSSNFLIINLKNGSNILKLFIKLFISATYLSPAHSYLSPRHFYLSPRQFIYLRCVFIYLRDIFISEENISSSPSPRSKYLSPRHICPSLKNYKTKVKLTSTNIMGIATQHY